MLLIFLSWIYILFTAVNLGYGVNAILKINNAGLIITAISGLFGIGLLTCSWAFFGRIHFEFHIALLLLSLLLYSRNHRAIVALYAAFGLELGRLIWPLKILLGVIALLILAQCATAPFVLDNETYYIQSIKWLNEYGFVKGLANLHISFGQMSGWHILQSAFNFSFLYKNFNDLSGFCLLLGNCFAIIKLNEFFLNGNRAALIVGLFPLANTLFFQMINAPSPDIPVYVFAFILFYLFVERLENPTISDFGKLAVLTLFILFIKVTAIGLALIPIVFLIIHFKMIFPRLLPVALTALLVLCLFMAKNVIISGLPLFPMSAFKLTTDHTVPENAAAFYFNSGKLCLFFISIEEFNTLSSFEIAKRWLFAPNIGGFLNLLSVLVLAVSPIFIFRRFNQTSVWIVYGVAIVQFALLLFTSPVYRYFIYLTIFFGFLIFASLCSGRKFIISIFALSVVSTAIVLFCPLDFNGLTRNEMISRNSYFSPDYVIYPHGNSKMGNRYNLVKNGNLSYHSPIDCPFFWANGDGDLPCVNREQIDYLEKYLSVVPQLRTTELGDGFYTKNIRTR